VGHEFEAFFTCIVSCIYLPYPGIFQTYAKHSPDWRLISSVGLSNLSWQWTQSGAWNIISDATNPVWIWAMAMEY
jgi:hypothetical protein